MVKYLKVIDGLNSNASGFQYKINEVNVSDIWNPNASNPKDFGGFNFSSEDKILRWLIRGDTIYDVEIPENAEIIDCDNVSAPHGVFRSNKIIISNPRKVDDELAMQLYLKSTLPEKSYYKAMAGCAIKGYINTALKIFEDKVNESNIELVKSEYEDFCTQNGCEEFDEKIHLNDSSRLIYDKIKHLYNLSHK